MGTLWAAALSLAIVGSLARQTSNAESLLKEADRLAWLRAWTQAEPIFLEAQRLFTAQGDKRNALYAEPCEGRARAHRLPPRRCGSQRRRSRPGRQGRADQRRRVLAGSLADSFRPWIRATRPATGGSRLLRSCAQRWIVSAGAALSGHDLRRQVERPDQVGSYLPHLIVEVLQ